MIRSSFCTGLMTASLALPTLAFGATSHPSHDTQAKRWPTPIGNPGQVGQADTPRSYDAESDEANLDKLTEAEVAGVLASVDEGELAAAKLAAARATNPKVKEFAQMLVKDVSATSKKAGEVNSQLGQEPQDSLKSMELKAANAVTMTILGAAKGPIFDRIFISQQIKRHKRLLRLIDKDLLPVVQSDSFKDFLNELRTNTAAHLDAAKEIRADKEIFPD